MNYNGEQANKAFKPIKNNPIILDFEDCKTLGEIHLVLKENFGLPDYYGENWDALWDCLDGLFYGMGDYTVEIHNFNVLENRLKEFCSTMLEIFDDVNKETPNVKFILIS